MQDTHPDSADKPKRRIKKHLNSLLTLFSLSLYVCVCVPRFPQTAWGQLPLGSTWNGYLSSHPADGFQHVSSVVARVVLRCRRTRRKRLTHSLIVSFYLEQRIEIDRNKEGKKSQRNSLNSYRLYIANIGLLKELHR